MEKRLKNKNIAHIQTNDLIKKLFECLIRTGDFTEASNDEQFKKIIIVIGVFDIETNFHSFVGKYIYNLSNEDFEKISKIFSQDVFLSLIQTIQSKRNESDLQKTIDIFKRLDDSIQLSISQRKFIEKNAYEANRIASKATKKAIKAQKIADQMQDIKKNIYTDFIAILGIFTAITFASFGATSMLTSVLTSIANPDLTKLGYCLVIISVYLLALYGLISVMLVGIYKLMHGHEKYFDDQEGLKSNDYYFSKKLLLAIVGSVIVLIIVGIILVDREHIPFISKFF
ncbi:hypothetical protein [Weissella soli]|uniref:hypothetical protein n=1 Tax=Weissella soli TaxID=155866 RepID=UPI003EF4BC19